MSKFLNETGLSHFWEKVKTYLSGNFLSLDGGNMNDGASIRIKGSGDNVGNTVVINSNGFFSQKRTDSGSRNVMVMNGTGIHALNEQNATTLSITPDDGIIKGKQIAKIGGTASQVLMADGSIKTIGAKSGIATLDANGRIPLSQLGNLDTTLFQVVDALPTSGIIKNRIYLVKSTSTSTQNIYAEYIYTGDVNATYDASKWEKLGEYKSDVDLSSYSKKSETVSGITLDTTAQSESDGSKTVKLHYTVNGVTNNANCKIPVVTTALSGIMRASDKKALDTLTARYPLSISSFSASPNLVEVGVAADVTFSWDFANTDFHPITSQSIVVDGAAAATVAVGTKSYKKTGLAGATTQTTKSASITINGSLKKSANITYHYPSYIGLVADGTSITEAVVKGLTKCIEWGRNKTKPLNQSNQKIVYAYPASYGDLTSIKDGNGFQGFAGYAKQTLTVGGQSYNVYVQKLPATANSTYTFA